MQFNNLFEEERAVSPVIGVILMVAITVILAAVIGTFVLGLGDQLQDSTPRASFGFDQTDDAATSSDFDFSAGGPARVNFTITHESGDTIDASNVNITVPGDSQQWNATGQISAGSSVVVSVDDGDTIRVVYSNPDSDNTATLGKHEASA